MAFIARFQSRCSNCGKAIRVGQSASAGGTRGNRRLFRHTSCPTALAMPDRELEAHDAYEASRGNVWSDADRAWLHPDIIDGNAFGRYEAAQEREAYRREMDRENAEYARGRAEGERYSMERKVYGDALANAFAAQDEWNSFWKLGEDY